MALPSSGSPSGKAAANASSVGAKTVKALNDDRASAIATALPPASRTVEEEGILIDDFPLVEGGVFRADAVRALLGSGPYPARCPDTNLADLHAQVAANEKGVQELAQCAASRCGSLVAARHPKITNSRIIRHLLTNCQRMFRIVSDENSQKICFFFKK